MMKQKDPLRYIKCANCGGTQGTLRKKEVIYEHVRESDCERHKKLLASKAKVMEQAKPVKE